MYIYEMKPEERLDSYQIEAVAKYFLQTIPDHNSTDAVQKADWILQHAQNMREEVISAMIQDFCKKKSSFSVPGMVYWIMNRDRDRGYRILIPKMMELLDQETYGCAIIKIARCILEYDPRSFDEVAAKVVNFLDRDNKEDVIPTYANWLRDNVPQVFQEKLPIIMEMAKPVLAGKKTYQYITYAHWIAQNIPSEIPVLKSGVRDCFQFFDDYGTKDGNLYSCVRWMELYAPEYLSQTVPKVLTNIKKKRSSVDPAVILFADCFIQNPPDHALLGISKIFEIVSICINNERFPTNEVDWLIKNTPDKFIEAASIVVSKNPSCDNPSFFLMLIYDGIFENAYLLNEDQKIDLFSLFPSMKRPMNNCLKEWYIVDDMKAIKREEKRAAIEMVRLLIIADLEDKKIGELSRIVLLSVVGGYLGFKPYRFEEQMTDFYNRRLALLAAKRNFAYEPKESLKY